MAYVQRAHEQIQLPFPSDPRQLLAPTLQLYHHNSLTPNLVQCRLILQPFSKPIAHATYIEMTCHSIAIGVQILYIAGR
jgi:hypothetical protein